MHGDSRQEDRVFAEEREAIADFRFGAEVARVFDDMLSRSVPFYGEIQRMVAELAQDIVVPGQQRLRPRVLDRHHDAAARSVAARAT